MHTIGIYINHVYDSPIPNMPSSNLLHINYSKSFYVQYWWNCEMNPYLWYLLPFCQNIPTSFTSLIVSCDVFEIFLIEVHSYTISENWSHRLSMLLSKHPLVYFMTSSWISCLIYFINLLCVHVSLWIILSTLQTHIHESVNLSPWYPCSLSTIFLSFWF